MYFYFAFISQLFFAYGTFPEECSWIPHSESYNACRDEVFVFSVHDLSDCFEYCDMVSSVGFACSFCSISSSSHANSNILLSADWKSYQCNCWGTCENPMYTIFDFGELHERVCSGDELTDLNSKIYEDCQIMEQSEEFNGCYDTSDILSVDELQCKESCLISAECFFMNWESLAGDASKCIHWESCLQPASQLDLLTGTFSEKVCEDNGYALTNLYDPQTTIGAVQRSRQIVRDMEKGFDIFETADTVLTILKVVEPASKFFPPIVGCLEAFVHFAPQEDSEVLKLVKELKEDMEDTFAKISNEISNEIGAVVSEIKWTNLRQSYYEFEMTIDDLSNDLLKYYGSDDVDKREDYKDIFVNKYISDFNGATYKLYLGMTGGYNIAPDIPAEIMKATSNHRRETLRWMYIFYTTIIRGIDVELAYYWLDDKQDIYQDEKDTWEVRKLTLWARIQEVDSQLEENMKSDWPEMVESFLHSYPHLGNEDFAAQLYDTLSDKFDWYDWQVTAYSGERGSKWYGRDCRENIWSYKGRSVQVNHLKESESKGNYWEVMPYIACTSLITDACRLKKCYYMYMQVGGRAWLRDYCHEMFQWMRIIWLSSAKAVYKNLPDALRKGHCWNPAVSIIHRDTDYGMKAKEDKLLYHKNGNFDIYVFGIQSIPTELILFFSDKGGITNFFS